MLELTRFLIFYACITQTAGKHPSVPADANATRPEMILKHMPAVVMRSAGLISKGDTLSAGDDGM